MQAETEVTSLDLLRHGHCSWPPGFYGISDNPLSEEGWSQMSQTLDQWGLDYDQVFSSPLSRCAGFAQHWSKLSAIECQLSPLLIEGNLGEWDGQTITALEQSHSDALERFWLDPLGNLPPGAETLDAMQHRMQDEIARIVQQYKGQRLLLVSHSGLIRGYLMALLGADTKAWRTLAVPHASLSRIKIYHHNSAEDWYQLEAQGMVGY
ncbi:histidine phosphatase family protein [Aestuariirhabdus sp. Z084]|uniref:histidine phosphatase family protein n=1 Tax=Aestuariirhabdus haliotis TaxID=2918751 RepID=UPI00201B41DD|nr:histidine phosphatase family protein [Aestuariirhabdus haliotis]MCL6414732.1 histidine phosphatase family protein [Aestuariirhabdus haliotis]MCL6418664.1 histidine phosphatase family protein [Aestuariirhabdus haliotis]